MKKVGFTLAFLLLVLSACAGKKSEEEASVQKAIVPVKVSTIKFGDMEEFVQANGQTEALRKENLVAPAAGRITRLMVQEGSTVASGETLAVILTKESLSALDGAQSLLTRAITSEQKSEAERALELARSNQNLMIVKSQIPGVVAVRSVIEGAMVDEGSDLLVIMDPRSINFAAQVPLKELGHVSIGQEARVNLAGLADGDIRAHVSAINPQSDTASQAARVLLQLSDSKDAGKFRLLDRMAGTAKIIIGIHNNIMIVPLAAVLRNDETNAYAVVTITADSLSKTVSINPGITQDSTMEISSPNLQPGMPVIIEGNYALPDSTRVTISRQEKK